MAGRVPIYRVLYEEPDGTEILKEHAATLELAQGFVKSHALRLTELYGSEWKDQDRDEILKQRLPDVKEVWFDQHGRHFVIHETLLYI